MKTILLFVFLLFNIGVINAQKTLKSKEILNIKNVTSELNNNSNSTIYSINSENIFELIKSSNKEYHLIYSFATWCAPCREYLPMLLDFIEKNKNVEIYILLIEKDGSKGLLNSKIFFDKIKTFNKPLFCITSDEYKKAKKIYYKFVKEIVPNHTEFGLSLNLLLNNKGEVLYASTYNENKEQVLENLNKLAAYKH